MNLPSSLTLWSSEAFELISKWILTWKGGYKIMETDEVYVKLHYTSQKFKLYQLVEGNGTVY